jgi:hypothetical protein
MRLHGTLFADAQGSVPITGYVADAENEERLQRVELRVLGNQIRIVPAMQAVVEDLVPAPAGRLPVPPQRESRIDGDDFR